MGFHVTKCVARARSCTISCQTLLLLTNQTLFINSHTSISTAEVRSRYPDDSDLTRSVSVLSRADVMSSCELLLNLLLCWFTIERAHLHSGGEYASLTVVHHVDNS